MNRGIHPSFENLYDKYPIQNRKIFDRLQNLCSQVAHWAPILADVSEHALIIVTVSAIPLG